MGKIEKKKIWMGALIIPPVVFLISMGPASILYLIVLFATFLGLREFSNLALPRSKQIERYGGIALGLILSLILTFSDVKAVPPFIVLLLLCLSIIFMGTSENLSSSIANIGVTLFGIFFIGFLLSYISLIRKMGDGRPWVLFLITTVWAGDISAFFGGSLLGKHKLYPKISPKKTYEGLVGAVIGTIIVALIFSRFFIPHLRSGPCILLAIGLGILGQLGDFTESMLKRSAQVKDSGSLIPGHGGMLDRLDSFLFSAPFLYYSLPYLLKETP